MVFKNLELIIFKFRENENASNFHNFKKILLVVFLFGIIGNILSFIAFSGKKFQKNSMAIYFRFIAISDSISILNTIYVFLKYELDYELDDQNYWLCKTFSFIIDSFKTTSALISILICLDRLVIIKCPERFIFLNSRIFQIVVCFILILISFICVIPEIHYSSYSLIKLENSNSNETVYSGKCNYTDPSPHIHTWFYLLIQSVVPFFIMLTCSFITIKTIIQSRKRSENVLSAKDIKFSLTSICLNIWF